MLEGQVSMKDLKWQKALRDALQDLSGLVRALQ
jgi:hypothetical protein